MNGRGFEILTVADTYAADRAAQALGVTFAALVEAAGRSVAATVRARWTPRPVAVLCGPGNNGADGRVAARALAAAGWPVRIGGPGSGAETMTPAVLDDAALVVDALFGAGLSRPIDGPVAAVLAAAKSRGLESVAIDVPSGVAGDSGEALGTVLPARLTVTFFRRKPAHLLLPGRTLCGETIVTDIGIPDTVLNDVKTRIWANGPEAWERSLSFPGPGDHKYRRGHALVAGGGPTTSGAGRLAARAALRVGAGLVTMAVGSDAAPVHAGQTTSVMVAVADDVAAWRALLKDPRRNAVLLGPGSGVTQDTRARVLAALATGRAIVLDADALTAFTTDPHVLFNDLSASCLLTPHEGEFGRLFAVAGDRLARAKTAAKACGAVVLLKGADTVIAAPDGRALIADGAPPWLATAGSGDVLAGLALGLIAQGVPTFEAAGAACWIHARAAEACGPGTISEDLVEAIPGVMKGLNARRRADHG